MKSTSTINTVKRDPDLAALATSQSKHAG